MKKTPGQWHGRLPDWPVHDHREQEAALRVLQSGHWWRGNGHEIDAFEEEFARFLEVEHVRAVTNGTQAIELALACLGIGPEDEVLVPACTFIATGSAVLTHGAIPIPVDVERDTLCMDIGAARVAISPRTRAIVPVHMAGQACDMDALLALARRHDLAMIEDAAHAHGARWNDRRLGSMGTCSIFSFQAGKLMTAGEGGALATSDAAIAEQTFARHSCGRPPNDREYRHLMPASNLRMTELQGAILRVQLERLPEQLATREDRAGYLDQRLAEVEGITPLARSPFTSLHGHYMYMAWFDPGRFGGRTASDLARTLRGLGLPAFRCFPPVHRTEMFLTETLARFGARAKKLPDYRAYETPVSDAAGEQVVWFHHSLLLADHALLDEFVDTLMWLRDGSEIDHK